MSLMIALSVFGGLTAFTVIMSFLFRTVVPTNEVHIVQSAKKTVSFGTASGNGNTYYKWPSWVPVIGVTSGILPVSNFDIDLSDYEAYDKGRLPFLVDVKAFFRISDSNVAAQRVMNFEELQNQLKAIVQGAVRSVLASNDIEEIMQGRGKFGGEFTNEVNEQLAAWGVETVRNLELMDIRDSKGSTVIHNIMEKKKSLIEMESRTEVAKNRKTAEMAEVDAKQEVDLRKQAATEAVGLRTVTANKEVKLADQAALQMVREAEKTTKEKEMAIKQVESVKQAEIQRQVALVAADQNKATALLNAEATKQTLVLQSEGQLEAKKREAQGIAAEGQAKADAEKAMQLAPVEAQIVLAKEIGANESYQNYLITIRKVEAEQAVGMEQAKALEKADVKVISNTGNAPEGLKNVMDLFSSKGGTQLGAALEGLAQTEVGQALLTKVTGPAAPIMTNGKAKA